MNSIDKGVFVGFRSFIGFRTTLELEKDLEEEENCPALYHWENENEILINIRTTLAMISGYERNTIDHVGRRTGSSKLK